MGLDKLILFDYLIDNYDRHMRNIEFMRVKADIILAPIFDSGSPLLSEYVDDDDLEFLRDDEDTFDEAIRFAQTQSKAFAQEHSLELRLVGRAAFEKVNLAIKEEAFKQMVEQYSEYLSSLRKEIIIELLTHRYKNIIKWSERVK
ncbi:HipA domain-containing protein [Niallia nealsonii]|uniref:HipA-like C-terminal domain-containing protein n=1 Tax=Niallia nealsonii TaxID=115979 RepID=A0A2N0Z6U2_9BACI|nr:hypothetical protein [Niallia nealsonii]PKG25246.1 hypothetical protein CWS01_02505 [Niallia nealsonii]